MMARVLGYPDYPFIVIDHPITSADDAALCACVRSTIEQIRQLLLRID